MQLVLATAVWMFALWKKTQVRVLRHRLTQDILYLGVFWSGNMKASPAELWTGISAWFWTCCMLDFTSCKHTDPDLHPSSHLTSIIAIKSKNWAPPTNNASCLGHYSFIIYILIYYLPWSRKVQFTWWVSIMFFTEVSKDSTNIIFPCQSREWHFSSNCPGTKVHRVKTEAPIHWVPDFLDCISKHWVLHRI